MTDGEGNRDCRDPRERERAFRERGVWFSMQITSRTVTQKAERILNHKEGGLQSVVVGVSQLLSKFGEHTKLQFAPRALSASTTRQEPGQIQHRDLFVQEDQSTEETDTSPTFRVVPKRSFSFSDRVVCQQETRDSEEKTDFKVVERSYSDRRVKTRVTDQSGSKPKVTRRCGRPKPDEVMHEKRQKERKVENQRNDSVRGETEEWTSNIDGGEGFTVASVKIPEGVAFARRVPIKQDGREISSEREIKKVREENEREIMIDKEIHRDKRRVEKETTLRQRPIEFQTEAKQNLKGDGIRWMR